MPFTSRRCWQRDVPPRCPRRRAALQRLSSENSTSRGGRDRLEELWWEKLAMKEAFRRHKRLLHSSSLSLSVPAVTLADLSNNTLCRRCHTFCFEPRTQTGVRVRRRMLVSSHRARLYPHFFFLSLNTCVQTADQPEQRIPRQPFNIERCETWWKEKENKWDVIFNVKHQMWAFIISHLPPPPLSCLAAVTLAVLLGATPCQVEFRDSDTVSSNPSSGLSVSPGEKKRRGRRTETQRKTSWKTRGDRSWKSGSQIERRFCFLQYSYESLVRVQGLTVQNRAFKS